MFVCDTPHITNNISLSNRHPLYFVPAIGTVGHIICYTCYTLLHSTVSVFISLALIISTSILYTPRHHNPNFLPSSFITTPHVCLLLQYFQSHVYCIPFHFFILYQPHLTPPPTPVHSCALYIFPALFLIFIFTIPSYINVDTWLNPLLQFFIFLQLYTCHVVDFYFFKLKTFQTFDFFRLYQTRNTLYPHNTQNCIASYLITPPPSMRNAITTFPFPCPPPASRNSPPKVYRIRHTRTDPHVSIFRRQSRHPIQ